MADVFVSYSRRDRGFVDRLNAALEEGGRDVWVDWDDIPPTADWLAQIHTGIEEANALVFVISPDSITSEVCAKELEVAETLNKRIVPLLLREIDHARAPEAVGRHNWIFFNDPERFDDALETLVQALDTDLDHVSAHTRWLIAAQRWDREDRDRSLLIRGSELTAAEAWLNRASTDEMRPPPLPLHAEFVRASREATARRQRITVAGVSVALVVAIALAIVALIQRSHAIDQRNAAIAGELDAQSQNQYETDPELSVLLATEAAKTNPGATTEEALRQALGRSHLVATYHSPAGEPGNALFSPHGDQLLVADGDETARLRTPGKPGVIELKAPGLVNQIAWSADGRAVVTGGSAPTVWNARTGEPIMALPGGIGAYEIALNRDASRVAAVEPNGTGHVFSVPGGRELATFDPPGSGPLLVSCFAFSANGRLAAECDQHGTHGATVYLWDGETGDLMRAVSTRGAIGFGGVDVSHDGKRVALASGGSSRRDGLVEVIRADDGGALYMRHEDSNAVQLSRDGGLAFAGGAQATVVDPQTRSEVSLVGHGDVIKALALGADDTRVVTGSVDGTARVWDTGGEQVELLAGHRDEVDSVSYSGDGELVATTSPDGDTRVWATDDPHPQVSVAHDEGAPGALVADPTGAGRLLYAGGGAATIIDSQTLKTEASIPLPPGETALGADWAPDGSLILVAAGDEASRDVLDASVADPDEAQAPVTIRPPGGLQSVAAASEGRVLTISDTGEAEAWDGHTGESLRRYDLKAPGASLGVSPDGDTAAVGAASGEVTVFDIGSGEHLQTIDGPPPEDQSAGIPPVPGVVFDQAGEQLATFGGDRKVRIWDLSNGELVRTLEGGESYFDSVAFSPDGKRVAGGDANGVYIWNAESGAQLQHLQHAPAGTFGSLIIGDFGVVPHFSADGRTLLSVGDFHVAAWDAQTGQRLFTDPFASVGDLAEDGQTVYSATTSELHLYRCNLCGDLNDLMTYARESVTRGLTDAEHERYLGEAQ